MERSQFIIMVQTRTWKLVLQKEKILTLGNFGKLNLSEKEIDPEEQHKALELWNAIKAINDKENQTMKSFQRVVKPTESPPMVQSNSFDDIPPPDYR
jgi:hypothetical protein